MYILQKNAGSSKNSLIIDIEAENGIEQFQNWEINPHYAVCDSIFANKKKENNFISLSKQEKQVDFMFLAIEKTAGKR